MSDIQIMMFCVVVLAITACVIHNSTKKIADKLYRRVYGIPDDPEKPLADSPYGVIRARNSKGGWGYSITKNGKVYRESQYSSSPVYPDLNSALHDMNLYESMQGYKITVLK